MTRKSVQDELHKREEREEETQNIEDLEGRRKQGFREPVKGIHAISPTRLIKELDRKIFASLRLSRKYKQTETTQQTDEREEVLDTQGQVEEMKNIRRYGMDKQHEMIN